MDNSQHYLETKEELSMIKNILNEFQEHFPKQDGSEKAIESGVVDKNKIL